MNNPKSEIRHPTSNKALAIIPARMASTRLPGKPLLAQTGKPLIQHVVENAQRAKSLSRIIVASDDRVIIDMVRSFGGEAILTGPHPNGTSRIAEALRLIEADALNPQTLNPKPQTLHDLIVNVQGDEPEIDPQVIDALVAGLAADDTAPMATLCSRFGEDEDPSDPNIVKLVRGVTGRAMYFSRSLIPFDRDAGGKSAKPQAALWKHPGLYAYRRSFLLDVYPTLSPTPLEEIEKLEQLRVLEHGHAIAVIQANAPRPGIDTPQQYAAFVKRWQSQ